MTTLLEQRAAGRPAEAWSRLHVQARSVADYPAMRKLCHARRKLLDEGSPPAQPAQVRLALLSGATIDQLVEPLQLALEAAGIGSTIHASAYNAYAREMLDPESATVRFGPDVALVITTPANIPAWPPVMAAEAEVAAVVDEVCEYWLNLCRTLHRHARCDVVLCNFHLLPLRPLGTAGLRVPGDANRFLRTVNDALARRAPDYVHIHDVETLASLHGVYRWFDHRFWYHAKQPVSFECLVPYVRSLAQLIAALRGRAAKCLVLDLDNTLWGGVVGDDGAARLVIGEGDAGGEAFAEFQRYLLRLRERGVLLAVASKNDERNALEPFASRPEMILRREDFVAFKANWRLKSENIREIARELNIGLDALVFVDDNPAEREEVRRALPDVRVLELGDDPAEYPLQLDRSGWFEALVLSAEDKVRTSLYAADTAREQLQSESPDYGDYLRSLEQRAVIAPFEERFLDRIAQLAGKTNQFNLTTRRPSRSQLAEMMASESYLTAYVRLADRFGDNGLISVFAARGEGTDLWIELWLMSCRVFNRGVEQQLCNHVVAAAAAAGYRQLHGVYLPTAKNGIVRELYRELGFAARGSWDGADHWLLDVGRYRPVETQVTVVAEYAAREVA